MIILQVAVDTLQNVESIGSAFEIVQKGGVILIPIALLSVWALYVFVERVLVLRQIKKSELLFMEEVMIAVRDQQWNDALAICDKYDLPFAKMIHKGISRRDSTIKEIEEYIEQTGRVEVFELEKGMTILSVIAGIAPMFGFLGTIVGVIKIFYDISLTADVSISTVSSGLYVKMVSSAAGLVVGIMSYIFYNMINSYIARSVNRMERRAIDFIDTMRQFESKDQQR